MSLPILLDTCAAMYILDHKPMKKAAVEAIDAATDFGGRVFVSPITAWEVGMLVSKGRFRSRYTPEKWLEQLQALPNLAMTAMPAELLMKSSFLPGIPPRDPWDRVVIATGREYGYTVITSDRAMLEYAQEGHLSALEC
ncbi:MAG TPA: type II toxin-antitoxin system VapC family toxin [Rhizomicrobium sp.]|jgi:PIN domain nuclease of toxin-antitoxin system